MRIAKVGIELEGGWSGKVFRKATLPKMVGDISVNGIDAEHVGEIVSAPMAPEEAAKWLETFYPEKMNESCGLHIHISFRNNRDYVKLLYRNFWDEWLIEVNKWAEGRFPKGHYIFKRLEGDAEDEHARFCQKRFSPSSQVRSTRKGIERRSQWNYCFEMHGTVESRVFPVFEDVKDAISAVEFTINFVEEYVKGFKLRNDVVRLVGKKERKKVIGRKLIRRVRSGVKTSRRAA